ncbi:MAG: uroporphyrinogen decarboxylase family protein [bacterium]
MNSRERVLASIQFREPDRVPWDYWAASEITDALCDRLKLADKEALLCHFGVDLRYVRGPSYVGQSFRSFEDESVEDLWGVRRRTMRTDMPTGLTWSYKHVVESPLERMTSVAEIDAYGHWPSADWWDYSSVAGECLGFSDFAVVNAGDRLDRTAQFKPMMYLRGFEQSYIDLVENPAIADAILDNIRNYFLEYNRRVFEHAAPHVDIFMMGDDFGTQNGPIIPLDLWRRFFKPGFKAYIDLAHEYGLTVMHHTCGSVRDLIPDFIECGLDILQSLQPKAAGMDLSDLKREFGRDLCFHGGVDIQELLPRGNPESIRREVKRLMNAGSPGGGFIISTAHNILPDVPLDNVLALYEAYGEFGQK